MKVKNKRNILPSPEFWKGKRVLVTGHTGFKGSWLALWLASMEAKVSGLALEPPTNPNFFNSAGVSRVLDSDMRVDILDTHSVCNSFSKSKPEIVFHMAAQSLVRKSYREPAYTFSVNSLGTMNILESIRNTDSVRTGIMVTTDKVYQNSETNHSYCEDDPLGGNDPYSASKACAEIIINSYRCSFFAKQKKSISSVRAGNVIGGGDWSEDRLIPDAIKAFISGKPLLLRNPAAIRPWQYILDVFSGYLSLAEMQWHEPEKFACAWNFAPYRNSATTVEKVAKLTAKLWKEGAKVESAQVTNTIPETGLLMLNATKARTELGWDSKYTLLELLQETVSWYKAWRDKKNMYEYSLNQIKNYIGSGENNSE